MAKDPVCGMMVDEKTAKIKSDFNGKTYYFCNSSCKTTFDKNPAKFA
jgi:YHS domain-containing protein